VRAPRHLSLWALFNLRLFLKLWKSWESHELVFSSPALQVGKLNFGEMKGSGQSYTLWGPELSLEVRILTLSDSCTAGCNLLRGGVHPLGGSRTSPLLV
jgi:hypothetical protein